MRISASKTIIGLIVVAWPGLLPGQTGADRRFLDSVLAEAGSATTEAAVPLLSRCDARDPDIVRICQAAIAIHHSVVAGKREEVFAAEDVAVHAVFERDRWPYAWLVLGLVRLQLAENKVIPHEGPAMPAGVSNELGGTRALIHALELDPGLAAAANALAMAPEPPEGAAAMAPSVAMLRQARALLSSTSLVATAAVEREAGSVDSAIAIERRTLRAGNVDSGIVALALARDLYRTGHPAEGREALLRGAATRSDAGRQAYRSQLDWVASPSELAVWDTVPAVARPAWLAGFWSSRDAADGRAAGERLVEHYRRLEYAMAHFRIDASGTDRPTTLAFVHSNDYLGEDQGLDFAFRHGNLCPETASFVADSRRIGADAPERYFQPEQDLVDDRGAMWIRHGPPTRSRRSNSTEAAEVWRYDRPDGALVLQFRAASFRGTTMSVLVPSLLTMAPGVRNQVCALEASICSRLGVSGPIQPGDTILVPPPLIQATGEDANCRMCPQRIDPTTHRLIRTPPTANGVRAMAKQNERCQDPIARILEREISAEGTLLGTDAIARARDSGRATIDLATTTDSYRRDFARTVHAEAQLLGLDHAAGGAPRLVIAYAMDPDDLVPGTSGAGASGAEYPVRLHVVAAETRTGARIDVDTFVRFPVTAATKNGADIVGMIEVPIAAGTYAVGVVLTQSDDRGASLAGRRVVVPGAAGSLAVSALVLGRRDVPVQWTSGTATVALNPRETYRRSDPAELYVQFSGLRVGTVYQTRYEFFRVDDGTRRAPRLSVSFAQPATREWIEVSRSLGLKNLVPGGYRVVLTIAGNGEQAMVATGLTIEK
ncbi:MAG: hypothetical protein ACREK8_12150 [Gemmatimonadales bacterium]